LKLTVIPERCSGCKTCELVCALKHHKVNNPKKANIRVMILYPQPVVRMPIVCQQCKEPKCASNCPVNCIKYRNGVVTIDHEECVTCNMCVVSCPFGAIFTHDDYDVPFKCDLCGGDPECVKACPKQAILYVPKHIIGQSQRMRHTLNYANMKQVEYVEEGEKKILKYVQAQIPERDNDKNGDQDEG
jgi:anaerobic carbon-monoxide dehydrogenase iron sulfur subunit